MQKTKTIPIGNQTFTVKELPTRVIWDLVNNGEKKGPGADRMKDLLRLGCPELTDEVLLDLFPSEIEELWGAFEEVNAAFLGLVRRVGLDQAIITAVKNAVMDSTRLSALSSSPDTAA